MSADGVEPVAWSIVGFTIISITVLATAAPNYSSGE